ncbi:hypothetical protein ACJMK2_004096 [Sinanodonta woodiana]|uniref:Helicase C-terminal domain-containing protein n=1 Tax=Sinanodonta woodiana TaxID=1069815 RepID=A0ABD3Y1S2_SINWO
MANLYNVILFGAPNSVVELIQEIGRVGRDEKDAVAFLLYNLYHLLKVDLEARNMYMSLECRRLLMLKPFLSTVEFVEAKTGTGLHSCCDFCAKNYSCCLCTLSDIEKLFQHTRYDASKLLTEDENTELYDLLDNDDIVDMSLLLDTLEVTE